MTLLLLAYYLLISLEAIFKMVPDSLFNPLLCLFLLVDCLLRIWFLLALLVLIEEAVFLKRLEAPECVFSLYPISLLCYLFFFKGDKTINNCLPSNEGS